MAITGDKITGNTKGISRFWLEQLEALYQHQVPAGRLLSPELAEDMATATINIGSEIAVYLDRHGRVLHVEVGDKHSVSLANLNKREGKSRLSGIRCIHTHPGGNGSLSLVDLTALPTMVFDAMVAIGVEDQKSPSGGGVTTTVGLAWGVLGEDKPAPLLLANVSQAAQIDLTAAIAEIEKNANKALQSHDLTEKTPRALLINITGQETEETALYSLEELSDLAKTAGLDVGGKMLQKRSTPESATYIGKGKADELRFMCQVESIDSLIFDNELSPVQIRNLETITGRAIIDRSMLILDIFAQRAASNEGKLQVELAQLKYMMPRLVGQGEVLSRLGGGIGTRGPGETKLEVDKRIIRKRINELENRLDQVVKTRKLHRQQRSGKQIPIVALVGYTNAGKSTLLNQLTDAGVLAEDKLFATLDTTTRKIELASGRPILLIDTVGFIRKLPHHLVAAFRATLEEVIEADLLLHIMDSSCPEVGQQAEAVNQVLTGLGCQDKPTIAVLNKIDKIPAGEEGNIAQLSQDYTDYVAVSAKQGLGMAELLAAINQILPMTDQEIDLVLPYNAGSALSLIHNEGKVSLEEFLAEGTHIKAIVPAQTHQQLVKMGHITKD